MKLKGTVAIVTGASRGIGAATARSLHKKGVTVGLLARSGADLAALADELETDVAIAEADIADRIRVEGAVAALTRELGPPDILVNNAGIGAYASILEEDPDCYERLMQVNYLGTVHATRAVLPGMVERRRGHIVNVASVAGKLGAPFEAAYSASKFAVVGFTESLAAEAAPFGIGVSLVNPGPVDTDFTDARGVPFQRRVPHPIKPERVAKAIVAAIEDETFEQLLPRWLRLGVVTRAVAPGSYRRGLIRDSKKDGAELVARIQPRRDDEPTE